MRRLFAAGFVVFLASQAGFACVDQILKTNTDPKVLVRRYREVRTGADRAERRERATDLKGAAGLKPQKADCFLYPNLRSQSEIPCLAPLVQAYENLPKRTRMVETKRDGRRVRLAVHQLGTGEQDNILICIPGVTSDSHEYRFVAGALGQDHDLWLIDPPGCGDSEAPNPAKLGPDGYSPSAMAERELQAMAICLAELRRPARVQLVAHSMGGLVALRALSDPDLRLRYGAVLDRIDGAILISPCDLFLSQVKPALIARSELSGLTVGLGQGVGVVREKVAQYLAGGFYASHCLSREEVDHAAQVVVNRRTRRAFQAMLQQALPFDLKSYAPRFEHMCRMEAWYTNVNLPVRILWGQCDTVLPVAMGYKLEKQLPNARLVVIPDCDHAPNLERPAECARLIRVCEQEIANQGSRHPRLVETPADASPRQESTTVAQAPARNP